jgi:hypothetical protein
MSDTSTRGRPLATEKRAAVALGFEWLLPECGGKRVLARELMVIDSPRFPSAPSCERSIRRDLEAQHNPVTELLDGAQRIRCESIGDWASLIESIERLERVHGKPSVYGFGWHWRLGQHEAEHCCKQLHIDESTFQLLSKSRSGCVLIISVHGRQITTDNICGSLGL